MSQWLVVTDLDGTLLDHHSYSFEPARAMLEYLRGQDIPVVLNTSKTAAELAVIRRQLHNPWPFVVENGAAILAGSRMPAAASALAEGACWQRFGIQRAQLLDFLGDARDRGFAFESFADMGVAGVCERTGLTPEAARAALARDYTEPFLWRDSSTAFEQFRGLAHQYGLFLVQGGRFWHLSGAGNKGEALTWLRQFWPKTCRIVALGDGGNDVPMLEAADIAVLVRPAAGDPPAVQATDLRLTARPGPAGWADSLANIIGGP